MIYGYTVLEQCPQKFAEGFLVHDLAVYKFTVSDDEGCREGWKVVGSGIWGCGST